MLCNGTILYDLIPRKGQLTRKRSRVKKIKRRCFKEIQRGGIKSLHFMVPLQLEAEVSYRFTRRTDRYEVLHEVFTAFAALEAVGQLRDPREL